MKYNLIAAIIGLIFIFKFYSCKKDTEVIKVDLGYEYFPSTIGNYIIYQVDSLYYNDFTSTIDTFNFQIKEKITENFTDLSNRETQRIERFYRKNEADDWLLKDVWFANKTGNTAEKVEENIRYVKLIFPLKKNINWNGNRFNNLGEQNYTLLKLHETFKIDNLKFDSIVYISQQNDSNLIDKKVAYEIYAKHIGLVYKKQIDIHDKEAVINYTLPLDLRANSGFKVIYKAINYGKD